MFVWGSEFGAKTPPAPSFFLFSSGFGHFILQKCQTNNYFLNLRPHLLFRHPGPHLGGGGLHTHSARLPPSWNRASQQIQTERLRCFESNHTRFYYIRSHFDLPRRGQTKNAAFLGRSSCWQITFELRKIEKNTKHLIRCDSFHSISFIRCVLTRRTQWQLAHGSISILWRVIDVNVFMTCDDVIHDGVIWPVWRSPFGGCTWSIAVFIWIVMDS